MQVRVKPQVLRKLGSSVRGLSWVWNLGQAVGVGGEGVQRLTSVPLKLLVVFSPVFRGFRGGNPRKVFAGALGGMWVPCTVGRSQAEGHEGHALYACRTGLAGRCTRRRRGDPAHAVRLERARDLGAATMALSGVALVLALVAVAR